MKQDNLNSKFIREIARIQSPVTFLGLAHVFGVPLVSDELDENKRPIARDFTDICADVIVHYADLPRKRKREFLKLLTQANKEGGAPDANTTTNSDSDVRNEEM